MFCSPSEAPLGVGLRQIYLLMPDPSVHHVYGDPRRMINGRKRLKLVLHITRAEVLEIRLGSQLIQHYRRLEYS